MPGHWDAGCLAVYCRQTEGTWIYPSRESTEGFRPWSHTPDTVTTVLMKTWNTRELLSALREQEDAFHAEGLRGVICRRTHALGGGKATEDQGCNDLSNARVTPVPEPPTAPHCTEKDTQTPHCQLPRLWPLLFLTCSLLGTRAFLLFPQTRQTRSISRPLHSPVSD